MGQTTTTSGSNMYVILLLPSSFLMHVHLVVVVGDANKAGAEVVGVG